jgi:transcriptional/translational regulatory protein YebC/TACO1
MELALEAGAEDIQQDDDGSFTVFTQPNDLATVREAVEKASIPILSAEVKLVPKTTTRIEGREAEQCLKLLAFLDDLDDVQSVAANFEVDDDVLEKFAAQ